MRPAKTVRRRCILRTSISSHEPGHALFVRFDRGHYEGEEEQFDTVHSYFALRSGAAHSDARGVLRSAVRQAHCLTACWIRATGRRDAPRPRMRRWNGS